jgi:integrase
LAAWTIRKIHFIISGAFQRAVRWKWVAMNPAPQAEPPSAPPPDPQPPTADEAACIVNAAWKDPDFGVLVWLAMTSGARRGELCGLRWPHLNETRAVLTVQRSIAQEGSTTWEKHTKTHQRRQVTLDPETVDILTEHRARCEKRAAALGLQLASDAFIFAASADGRIPLKPSSVTQRYERLAARLGIVTTLHKLRHYSATELVSAGVDIRTVAGRLGHAGGGTTTLRIYAAWVSEADQRAAGTLLTRMPARPAPPPEGAERAKLDPRRPYERIAAALRLAILDGSLPGGSTLQPVVQLAREHGVAEGTALRALALLKDWGLVDVSRGRRATVLATRADERPPAPPAGILSVTSPTEETTMGRRYLIDLEIRRKGRPVAKLTAEADPKEARDLRRLLVDAIKRDGRDEAQIGDYEMDVRYSGKIPLITTFVATAR